MSDYENDFEEEEVKEPSHLIRVTVNLKSVNLNQIAALLTVKFTV